MRSLPSGERQHFGERHHGEIELARHHVLEHRRRAAIADMLHIEAELGLEHLADDVADRALAARAEGHGLALGFDPGDQLGHIFRRHRRPNHEGIGHRADIGHVYEILQRIVGRLVEQVGRDRERR
jgi:hypothetical protein